MTLRGPEATSASRDDPALLDALVQTYPPRNRSEHGGGSTTVGHHDGVAKAGSAHVLGELRLQLAHTDLIHVVMLVKRCDYIDAKGRDL